MHGSLDTLIAGLRNRKQRITNNAILSGLFLIMLIVQWFVMNTVCRVVNFKEGSGLFIMMAALSLFAVLFALHVSSLFIDLFGRSKYDLLVNLWDRIEALEKSIGMQSENRKTEV